MAPRYDNVIVFGPTGAVGSNVALEASKRGATVWLAMRDTNKTIPGLTSEKDGKFHRVQADLINPDSVRKAIQESKAKAAFLYVAFGPNGLKPTLEVMKEAGVEYVVFLSSFTLEKGANIREITPDAFIPYFHATVEIALEDVGLDHTALRPGSFASNPYKMGMDASKSPAELYVFENGKRMCDNIVPTDIGRVGGAVLVNRPSSASKEAIYLYGPNVITELETLNTVKDLSSKDIKVVQQTSDEWVNRMKSKGVPPPAINYMKKMSEEIESKGDTNKISPEDQANIKKYSGYEPTTLEEFIKAYEAQ